MSKSNLKSFYNEKFGTIRTASINGEPFLVGKDVAQTLGYSNPQKALRDHVDEEDKGVNEMDTPGGKQKIILINESGLYSLILSSKLPAAKEFKHWVTSEVLPAIRQTGGYILGEKDMTDEEIMAHAIIIADSKIKLMGNRIKQLEEENASLLPDAVLARDLMKFEDCYTLKEVADMVEVGRTKFCSFLRSAGVLSKKSQRNIPLRTYETRGYFKVKIGPGSSPTTVITAKGLKYIHRLITKHKMTNEFDTDKLIELAQKINVA